MRERRAGEGSRRQRQGESGSSLIPVLVLLLLGFMLAGSLLFTSEVDSRTSRSYADSLIALNDSDSAVQEVRWRLDLSRGTSAPPAGSTVSVNNLVNYDAAIEYDSMNILGNEVDDDGDTIFDEFDELNFGWDWQARILMVPDAPNPGPPWEYADSDITSGPPWGSHFVEATIQPRTTWRVYSTSDVTDAEVLSMRFKLDTDTAVGDSEGDGAEIVFYDPALATDRADDVNTLIGMGGDGDPTTDSPYNITYFDGTKLHPATGSPVVLVETTAHVVRGGVESDRRIRAEIIRPFRRIADKALCGCAELTIQGSTTTDSFKSSEGSYGSGPVYQNGNVGTNGTLTIGGGAIIAGSTESGLNTDMSGLPVTVTGDADAGGAITGNNRNVLGTETPFLTPAPAPCRCDEPDVDAMVAAAMSSNDNGNLVPTQYRTRTSLNLSGSQTVLFAGGDYYFDSIRLTAMASLQVGIDTDGDLLADAPPTKPVRIFIAGSVSLGGQGVINQYSPTYLELYCAAKDTNVPPESVSISGGTEFRGMVFAPYTEVDLTGGQALHGSVVAKRVKKVGDGPVHYDEDLRSTALVWYKTRVLAWSELP